MLHMVYKQQRISSMMQLPGLELVQKYVVLLSVDVFEMERKCGGGEGKVNELVLNNVC